MKKINIILIFLLSILWIPNTFAQARIEVTVQNATNGNNNGALTIEVFETSGLYSYYVFDRNGEDVDSAIDAPDNSKTFTGIAPGEYEVIVHALLSAYLLIHHLGQVLIQGKQCILVIQ